MKADMQCRGGSKWTEQEWLDWADRDEDWVGICLADGFYVKAD